MKNLIRRLTRSVGYDIVRYVKRDPLENFADFSEPERAVIRAVQPFTMTSHDRLGAVINAVTHLVHHKIPGDIAECGVWRGGSTMAAALTLKALGDTTRTLYLYDTYEGMSAPTEHDRSFDGRDASSLLKQDPPQTGVWCCADLDDVRRNLLSTGYPADKIVFVKGKVEDTIPATIPASLALLRLDTDWYESTQHELKHLYPRLIPGGIMIIDDYGHWQGARRAVDEFFAAKNQPTYLHRIDYTGRLHVKPSASAS